MATPVTPAELLEIVRRDPMAAFTAIPIFAMRGGTAKQVIELKGHTIALPMWTGSQWQWYGGLARDVGIRGLKDISPIRGKKLHKALERLDALEPEMAAVGSAVAPPALVAKYYFAAGDVVNHAKSLLGAPTTGDLLVASLPSSPEDVRRGMADALALGLDALRAIGRKAKEVANAIWGTLSGILLLGALGYLWWESRKRRRREED